IKNKLLIITFFILSLNAFSQNWVEVTKDKFGNKYYIKSSIISKGGNFGNNSIIKIWTKQTVNKISDQRSKGKGKVYLNAYMLILMEFDCENLKSRTLSQTAYSSKGAIIGENNVNENFSDWNYIIPDSVGETIFQKVCELYN